MYTDQRNQITVYFDGGRNAHGGYGSWLVDIEGVKTRESRKRYGKVTNNVAEYMALIRALAWIEQRIHYPNTKDYDLRIYGDSQLVVNQSKGWWQVRAGHLKALCIEVKQSMRRFRSASIYWHQRNNSVRILGH